MFPGYVQLHTGLCLHRYCCRVLLTFYHLSHPRPSLAPYPIDNRPNPTFLVTTSPRLRRPTVCEWEPTPNALANRSAFCGHDPPAPQPDSHAALARTVGPPPTVTSQTTRRNGPIYFMPRVAPSQSMSTCIRKHMLYLSRLYMAKESLPTRDVPEHAVFGSACFRAMMHPWFILHATSV